MKPLDDRLSLATPSDSALTLPHFSLFVSLFPLGMYVL